MDRQNANGPVQDKQTGSAPAGGTFLHQAENPVSRQPEKGLFSTPLASMHHFSKIPVLPPANPKPLPKPTVQKEATTPQPAGMHLLVQAATENPAPLDAGVRQQLERQTPHNFGNVRVYQGPSSERAATSLGARAFTFGNAIHLGAEAGNLPLPEKQNLLIHEAVHTIQQGGANANLNATPTVSHPGDAAETEAAQIVGAISAREAAGHAPALALRNRMRAKETGMSINQRVAPHVQRDLKGKHTVRDGTFNLDLKTESHAGAKSGMSGTIKFKASGTAPDSGNIRLLQIVRLEDLSTGKEYVWSGGEANRNKVMTTADTSEGITGGYFVDLLHAGRTPRSSKTDPAVSPYYIDDYGSGGGNQDGSKAGKTIQEASLWDYPGWSANSRFTFETAAKAADTGYIYATLTWGFTISDASKGTVDHEHAAPHRGPSATFKAAVKAFNEFYKNPGAATAP